MSQSKPANKATKRSRPITAWLKKENVIVDEEAKAKALKQSVRITLQPLDKNIVDAVQRNKFQVQGTTEKQTSVKHDKKSVADNNVGERRSNRIRGEKVIKEENRDVTPERSTLPEILFKGSIKYIHDFYDCASICDNLLNQVESCQDNIIPVGFDLEWPFNFQTGSGKTALAQICFSEKVCYLLYIYSFQKLPTSFIALLSHPKVRLVGVNIKNDVWKLTRDFKEFPGQKVVDNNCLDCGPYANTVLSRSCRWSLERLTAYLLRKKISKNPKVRNSKWHVHPLNNDQKLYAATDAYVSLLIHQTIDNKKAEKIKEAEMKEKDQVAEVQ